MAIQLHRENEKKSRVRKISQVVKEFAISEYLALEMTGEPALLLDRVFLLVPIARKRVRPGHGSTGPLLLRDLAQ